MNQETIEHLTYEYLSSYFGNDLNESIDQLSEEDLAEAILRLNNITAALNEQALATLMDAGRKAADYLVKAYATKTADNVKDVIGQNVDFVKSGLKPGDGMVDAEADKKLSTKLGKMGVDRLKKYGEMTRRGDMSMDEFDDKYKTLSRRSAERRGPDAVAKIEKLFKADDAFKRNLPGEIKYEVDKIEAKAATDRAKVKAGRGTVAGERKIDQLLSKPSDSTAGEASRQSAIASRQRSAEMDKAAGLDTAAGDPDTFEFYQDNKVRPTGKTDSGEEAYTADDRLRYQVRKEVEKRQKKGDFSLPGGGYDYAAIRRSMTEQATEPGGREALGGATNSPENMKRAEDEMKARQREANKRKYGTENPTDEQRAAYKAEQEAERQNDPAYLKKEEQRLAKANQRQTHSDNVRLAITNRRRRARGMSELKMSDLLNTQANKASFGVRTIADRQQDIQNRLSGLQTAQTQQTQPKNSPLDPKAVSSMVGNVMRSLEGGLSLRGFGPTQPFDPDRGHSPGRPGFRTPGSY